MNFIKLIRIRNNLKIWYLVKFNKVGNSFINSFKFMLYFLIVIFLEKKMWIFLYYVYVYVFVYGLKDNLWN